MKTFVEKFIGEKAFIKLNLDTPFYIERGQADSNEVLVTNKCTWVDGIPSLDIDVAINALSELKDAGANRVYFATHGDHHGYYIYGVLLKRV